MAPISESIRARGDGVGRGDIRHVHNKSEGRKNRWRNKVSAWVPFLWCSCLDPRRTRVPAQFLWNLLSAAGALRATFIGARTTSPPTNLVGPVPERKLEQRTAQNSQLQVYQQASWL